MTYTDVSELKKEVKKYANLPVESLLDRLAQLVNEIMILISFVSRSHFVKRQITKWLSFLI